MDDKQLLSDLVEWFETMCNLDLQSDAEDILWSAPEPARPELSEWEKYRILTDGIRAAVDDRKKGVA